MKKRYVIQNLQTNNYVCFNNYWSNNISDAILFEDKIESLDFISRELSGYFIIQEIYVS